MSETVAIKEHDRLFDLYDADGCLVGKANPGKKVMLADAFYAPERTCRIVLMDMAGNPPYRTGDWILDALSDGCSECGYPFDTLNKGKPNYCPHCGARVIEEES